MFSLGIGRGASGPRFFPSLLLLLLLHPLHFPVFSGFSRRAGGFQRFSPPHFRQTDPRGTFNTPPSFWGGGAASADSGQAKFKGGFFRRGKRPRCSDGAPIRDTPLRDSFGDLAFHGLLARSIGAPSIWPGLRRAQSRGWVGGSGVVSWPPLFKTALESKRETLSFHPSGGPEHEGI